VAHVRGLPRTIRVNHILERLRNAKYISTLDLRNGYWQITMAKDSRACTAFTVPGRGLFQWRVMPFGLHLAPATFQSALDSVIGPDLDLYAFAYLDDIIVIGASLEEHMDNLRKVFEGLRRASGPAHDEPVEGEPMVEVGAEATECLRSPEKFTDRRTRAGMPRFLRQADTPD